MHTLTNKVENTAEERETSCICKRPIILPSVGPKPPGTRVAIPNIKDNAKIDIESNKLISRFKPSKIKKKENASKNQDIVLNKTPNKRGLKFRII